MSKHGCTQREATVEGDRDDLQMLTNLWQLFHTSCARGRLDPQNCNLDQHTLHLTNALTELANDKERKNKSLQARTELTFMRLALQASKGEDIRPSLTELRAIIREAKGMISYPFEPIPKIVEELGNFVTDLPEYDDLLA
jgi:hypothetical protein